MCTDQARGDACSQAVRFVKALACMGAHLTAVKHLPIEALESGWYHGLSLPRKCAPSFVTPPSPELLHPIRPK